jgi:hypothetical protein
VAQRLVNAQTGQVESPKNYFSGNPTYRALAKIPFCSNCHRGSRSRGLPTQLSVLPVGEGVTLGQHQT